jgi:hypothetical protein
MLSLFYIRFALYLIFAIPAAIADMRTFRVPRVCSWGGIAVMTAFYLYTALRSGFFNIKMLYAPLIAAAVSFIIYFIARLVTSNGLGVGDVVYGVFTGLFCSFPAAVFAIANGALLGLLFYLVCAFKDRPKHGGHIILRPTFAIPYIPFITAGAVLVMICIIFFRRY